MGAESLGVCLCGGVLSILRSHLCHAHEMIDLVETQAPSSLWYGLFINPPYVTLVCVFLSNDTFLVPISYSDMLIY